MAPSFEGVSIVKTPLGPAKAHSGCDENMAGDFTTIFDKLRSTILNSMRIG
jgi:hypothetical protein